MEDLRTSIRQRSMPSPQQIPKQSGVIPYRRTQRGLEILLVTSNTRKRWIIPKGNVEPLLGTRESARREAFEEAGVRGRIQTLTFGTYQHISSTGPTLVDVFLMEVEQILDSWPEKAARVREWMLLRNAYDRILEEGLKKLLRELDEILS